MRPNVLLITADQWRGDCLGIADHPVVRTPNIDRLARSGTWFARHYAQAAPCGPSRASLYTGLYQMNHRVVRNGTPLDNRHDNIARAMRRAGYAPTLFGFTDQSADPRTVAADSPWLRTYEGILPGFDVAVRLPEDVGPWLDWLEARGHRRPKHFWEIYLPATGRSDRPTRSPPRYGADETETAFLAGCFLNWLDSRPAGEPWFAHVSFLRPHPPFIVPEPFNRLYDAETGPAFRRAASAGEEARQHPLLAYWHDRIRTDSAFLTPPHDSSAPRIAEWGDADFRLLRAIYWGMISEVDGQIGRIMDRIDALGSDTVVILTSDHGEMLGDHWTIGKFGYFDQAFHVPLIIRDPRRPGEGRVDAFTEAVDIAPTILELVDAPPISAADGHSLASYLEGLAPARPRDCVHWEYDFREPATGAAQAALGLDLDDCALSVIRDERFKYVHCNGLPPLLFDLAADPDELHDVSGEPAYQAVRLDYAERLLRWRGRHLDRTFSGVLLTADGVVDARA
ncbi:MAG TPA: alkaline phosphatase family protein [Bauldia sp.]|nr:alkaline phosphatase family protein [Bauldia sp.]